MPPLYDEDILEKFDLVPPLSMELDDLEEIDEELMEEEVTTLPAGQRPEHVTFGLQTSLPLKKKHYQSLITLYFM